MTQLTGRERGILFQGWGMRAILEGRKTQTRRVIRPQPPALKGQKTPWGNTAELLARCPYGQPGDLLWVRETWAIEDCGSRVSLSPGAWPRGWPIDRLRYPATDEAPQKDSKGRPYWWNLRASIHMPRWASRLTLRLTEVRVQRVAEISDGDVAAEGVEWGKSFGSQWGSPARDAFAEIWDTINGKRPGCSWEANPWVWALSFEKRSKP